MDYYHHSLQLPKGTFVLLEPSHVHNVVLGQGLVQLPYMQEHRYYQ